MARAFIDGISASFGDAVRCPHRSFAPKAPVDARIRAVRRLLVESAGRVIDHPFWHQRLEAATRTTPAHAANLRIAVADRLCK